MTTQTISPEQMTPLSEVSEDGLQHSRTVDLSDGLQPEERATASIGIIAADAMSTEDQRSDAEIDDMLLTRDEMDFVEEFSQLTSRELAKLQEASPRAMSEGTEAPLHAKVLAEFGLDDMAADVVIDAWASISPTECLPSERAEYLTECIRVLKEIRAVDPEYPAELFYSFGIRHFGRYPADVLVRQVDLLRNGPLDKPVVVATDSAEDYNNSGYSVGHRPVDIYGGIEESGDAHVVYLETGDVPELVQHLRSVRQAVRRPISALFIAGHGSKSAMQIGNSLVHRRRFDSMAQLERIYEQDLLTPGAETVLVSCNVGARGGLAEKLSERSDRHVIAAPVPILLNPIERIREGVFSLSYKGMGGVRRMFGGHDTGGIRYARSGVYNRTRRRGQAVRITD